MNKSEELIEVLQGTCMDLDSGIQEVYGKDQDSFSIDQEILDEVDLQIFLCDCCSWWCEISEESELHEDARICEDCEDEY